MKVFFNSWDSIIRVFLILIFAYPGLIILLRIYGKRSLSKLNMFDFIVTVALGSTFASVIISPEVTLIDGLIAFVLLLSAQYGITKAAFHWKAVDHLIKSEPTLLYIDDQFLEENMQSTRVTEDEIYAEIRQNNITCLKEVYAVVLETNGMLSILPKKDPIIQSTLKGVKGYDPKAELFKD
ncbi:DUF421 domain-containing protein [Anaerolineales bacterium]